MTMHELYDIVEMKIAGPYTLWMKFDDGIEQTIDFSPILRGKLYSPLRDLQFFNQVRLDPETKVLVWPNGADFDPETLHNWQEYLPAFERQVAKWVN